MDNGGRLIKRAQDTYDGVLIIPSRKFCNNAVGKSLFLISTSGYFFLFLLLLFYRKIVDPGPRAREEELPMYGVRVRVKI